MERIDVRIPDAVAGNAGYENTLLDETTKGIVQKQVEYGRKRGVPWGISESGYNLVDANLNYQYHAFGVPGTGFKRGLGEDLGDRTLCNRNGVDGDPERSLQEPETITERRL
jgi:cyclic beta-1,2-glucan synthetase